MTTLSTDTAYKAVDFVATFTGRPFYPMNPRVEDISIIDIAHHLSNQCRYGGASRIFYSTAQHCCLLADHVGAHVPNVKPLDRLQALMHDAAETYLPDMVRPLKQHVPQYRQWDHDIQMCVRSWLDLDGVPIPSWQDEFDSRIIADERERLINPCLESWQHDVQPLGVNLNEIWGPLQAEQQFLRRYAHYSGEHFGTLQYLRSGWGITTNSIYTPDFRTGGSDMAQRGDSEPLTITDLIEVDIRGGVGRVALRSEDGMMIRDPEAGSFPRPAWQFIFGKFTLTKGTDNGLV